MHGAHLVTKARSRLLPLGGKELSAALGTEKLPLMLTGGKGAPSTIARLFILWRHGAGGVKQLAKGFESLSGGAGAI